MAVERMKVFPEGLEDGISEPKAEVNQKPIVLDLI